MIFSDSVPICVRQARNAAELAPMACSVATSFSPSARRSRSASSAASRRRRALASSSVTSSGSSANGSCRTVASAPRRALVNGSSSFGVRTPGAPFPWPSPASRAPACCKRSVVSPHACATAARRRVTTSKSADMRSNASATEQEKVGDICSVRRGMPSLAWPRVAPRTRPWRSASIRTSTHCGADLRVPRSSSDPLQKPFQGQLTLPECLVTSCRIGPCRGGGATELGRRFQQAAGDIRVEVDQALRRPVEHGADRRSPLVDVHCRQPQRGGHR